jgi:arylsulfatase A-like enzyme
LPRQLGGYEGFRELGLQDSTAATWLDDVGYETFYAGKLLNGYENERYVPPGWDEWYAFSGHPHWTHYEVNENGELRTYRQADKHETYYLRDRAEAFVRDHAKMPMPPRFNEADVTDKPEWVQKLPRMDPSSCSRGGLRPAANGRRR